MKITALEYDSRRDKMVLVTDAEREFSLSFEDYAARKSLYAPGVELEGELLEVTELLEARAAARDKALKTLSYSAKTAKALMRVLTDAGFAEDIARETVLSLKKAGYIDEKDYCRRCTELYAKKGYGPVRIRFELSKKGFTQKMIDYTLERDKTDFEALLREQMRKRRGKTDYGSIYRYFYSRGYGAAMISEAYREIFE